MDSPKEFNRHFFNPRGFKNAKIYKEPMSLLVPVLGPPRHFSVFETEGNTSIKYYNQRSKNSIMRY